MQLSREVFEPSPECDADSPAYRAIYVHVPFCRRVCAYCDFAVTALRRPDPRQGEYRDAILREIARIPAGIQPVTLFFGGGTPSALAPELLAEIVDALRARIEVSRVRETSIECNPEDVDPSFADHLSRLGFDRASLGVQTLSPNGRRLLTRSHDESIVERAIRALRRAGIRHVSVDLILAWPGQTRERLEQDIDTLIQFGVDHVSCYVLTYESGTPFTRGLAMGVIQPASDSLEVELLRTARDRLESHGFHRYEISNHARPGHACLHNRIYWRRQPYLGIGPSAASFTGTRRFRNTPRFEDWARALLNGQSPRIDHELLDTHQHFLEFLMLSLRTARGIRLRKLTEFLERDPTLIDQARLEEYLRSGLLERTRTVLRATERGIELADELACGLSAHDHSPGR